MPKREPELGWTFNLTHPRGALGFIAVTLAPAAIMLILFLVVVARRT